MQLALGIDTGGTYTDAVLVNHETGAVLAGAKALTTRAMICRWASAARSGRCLASLSPQGHTPSPGGRDARRVSRPRWRPTRWPKVAADAVCLLLIGYDPGLIQKWGFHHDLATDDVVYLEGGHDGLGDEVAPLDEAAARAGDPGPPRDGGGVRRVGLFRRAQSDARAPGPPAWSRS